MSDPEPAPERWTVVLQTEMGGTVDITDDDARQKRKVLQFVPPREPTP